MPYNPANEVRECLWCETPIEGRADKQFCSSSCKARYNRENANEPPQEPIRAVATARPLAAPLYPLPTSSEYIPDEDENDEDESDDTEDWATKFAREAQEKRDHEKAKELHNRYTALAEEFLREEDTYFSLKPLDDLIDEMNQATGDYRQHPGLLTPTHPAHARLADHYLMGDYLRGLRQAVAAADAAAHSIFGKSKPDEFCMALSKKHRKRLRANLLGKE